MSPRASRSSNALTLALENRDPKIEKWLKDYQVSFEYQHNVPVTQIDLDRSRRNQSRFKAVDEETVAKYTNDVRNGDIFPPLIAFRPNKGRAKKLTLIDGNHRAAAHLGAQQPVDVYVLDDATPPDTIEILTYMCNMKNGLPIDENERLNHAVTLKEDHNFTVAAAAEAFNVSVPKLNAALKKRAADRRAVDAGIDEKLWDSLQTNARVSLNGIKTDEILADAARLAYDARLSNTDVQDLVKQLNSTTSITRQREIMKNARALYRDKIAATKNGQVSKRKGAQTPKHRINLALSHLLGLPNDPHQIARSFPREERELAREQIEGIVKKFTDLLNVLGDE